VHEQIATHVSDPPPVTAVLSVPVEAEQMVVFKHLHDLSVQRMTAMPGFLHAELLEPVPGVQDDTVILLTFDTRHHLDEWLESDDRKQLVELQSQHLLGPRTLSVVGGFAGWFNSARDDVVRWRSAAAVLIAIVPASLIYLMARMSLFPHVNVVVATIVGNIFTVAALTWVLMPPITRRLEHWLRRQQLASSD
jgi:antibiotic biosynthesis monooxygenase (ABM) superfamily enzyme